jgi:hypothetical protein
MYVPVSTSTCLGYMRERRRREGTTLWLLRDSGNDTSGGSKRKKGRGESESEIERFRERERTEGGTERWVCVCLSLSFI